MFLSAMSSSARLMVAAAGSNNKRPNATRQQNRANDGKKSNTTVNLPGVSFKTHDHPRLSCIKFWRLAKANEAFVGAEENLDLIGIGEMFLGAIRKRFATPAMLLVRPPVYFRPGDTEGLRGYAELGASLEAAASSYADAHLLDLGSEFPGWGRSAFQAELTFVIISISVGCTQGILAAFWTPSPRPSEKK
ncbi:unnamed protein product [Polarella glacialis]|uniref:Uncharacterized protein n=1 Tax=Polarella glacialis TaxID=89957 RepID=A0A813GS52_POLGL|nr:unnamed protein product [Polarella glacialis]